METKTRKESFKAKVNTQNPQIFYEEDENLKFSPYHQPRNSSEYQQDYSHYLHTQSHTFTLAMITNETIKNSQLRKTSVFSRSKIQQQNLKNRKIRSHNIVKSQPNTWKNIQKAEDLNRTLSVQEIKQHLLPRNHKRIVTNGNESKQRNCQDKFGSQEIRKTEKNVFQHKKQKSFCKTILKRAKSAINKPSPDERQTQKEEDYLGYVSYKFESKLRPRCLQDNLNVMASLLKKKIKIIDKRDIQSYLKNLISRKAC